MKKFFYMSVLVLMAALTLASCGGDEPSGPSGPSEPSGPSTPSGPTGKTAVYEFTANFTQDMIDICDVTMVYKDGDGKTVREAATSTKFTKKVNVNKFPAVVGAKCEFKLKDGVQFAKDKYDLIATYDHTITVSGKTPIGNKENTFLQGKGVDKNKIAELLSRRSGLETHGFTIDANGITNTTHNITF